jgi:hypothetical protein
MTAQLMESVTAALAIVRVMLAGGMLIAVYQLIVHLAHTLRMSLNPVHAQTRHIALGWTQVLWSLMRAPHHVERQP